MAKRHATVRSGQHARGQALLQPVGQVTRERLQQPHLNPPGTTATACSNLRAGSTTPRTSEYSVAHHVRNALPFLLRTLVTKNGLPPVLRYSTAADQPARHRQLHLRLGESGSTFSRRGRSTSSPNTIRSSTARASSSSRKLASTTGGPSRPYAPQAASRHPTSPRPPNQVLEHQHRRRPPAELAHQRRHHHVRSSTLQHQFLELAPALTRQTTAPNGRGVNKGSRPPQHPHRESLGITERAHQRRLANSSLTSHQTRLPRALARTAASASSSINRSSARSRISPEGRDAAALTPAHPFSPSPRPY